MINGANRTLTELNSLVEYKLTKAGENKKVDHLRWVQGGREVERLRKSLSNTTGNLDMLLGVVARYLVVYLWTIHTLTFEPVVN